MSFIIVVKWRKQGVKEIERMKMRVKKYRGEHEEEEWTKVYFLKYIKKRSKKLLVRQNNINHLDTCVYEGQVFGEKSM